MMKFDTIIHDPSAGEFSWFVYVDELVGEQKYIGRFFSFRTKADALDWLKDNEVDFRED